MLYVFSGQHEPTSEVGTLLRGGHLKYMSEEPVAVKRKQAIAILMSGTLTILSSGQSLALEVPNKDEVVKIAREAIDQGKQGQAEGKDTVTP